MMIVIIIIIIVSVIPLPPTALPTRDYSIFMYEISPSARCFSAVNAASLKIVFCSRILLSFEIKLLFLLL